MRIGFFTVTEWIAVITFLSGLIYGFAKLYSSLQSILSKLETLVMNFDESKNDRAVLHREIDQLRLDFTQQKTSVDERFKTLFRNLPDIKQEGEKNK